MAKSVEFKTWFLLVVDMLTLLVVDVLSSARLGSKGKSNRGRSQYVRCLGKEITPRCGSSFDAMTSLTEPVPRSPFSICKGKRSPQLRARQRIYGASTVPAGATQGWWPFPVVIIAAQSEIIIIFFFIHCNVFSTKNGFAWYIHRNITKFIKRISCPKQDAMSLVKLNNFNSAPKRQGWYFLQQNNKSHLLIDL